MEYIPTNDSMQLTIPYVTIKLITTFHHSAIHTDRTIINLILDTNFFQYEHYLISTIPRITPVILYMKLAYDNASSKPLHTIAPT